MLSLTSATAASPLILIVDDDIDSCEMYSACVKHAGLRVEQAYDGLAALDRALVNPPDLLVTDIVMPGIDGFELTQRLRTSDSFRALPVIAVTARSLSSADIDRLDADGPSSVLMKPCEPVRLLAEIWRLLQRARTTRERSAALLEQSAAARSRAHALYGRCADQRERWLTLVSSRRLSQLERIRGEFEEMRGLSLTVDEAGRLWALDEGSCRELLATLVGEGFLVVRNGRFLQANGD